jgi:Undecaprenyl-phosphate glucose phosphotransferase
MLKQYERACGHLFRAVDASIVVGAWLASYWIRFDLPAAAPALAVTRGLPDFETYAALSPLVAVLWVISLSWMRAYESMRFRGVALVLKAHGLALLVFVAITFLFKEYRYSRLVIIYFALLSGVMLLLFRLTVRHLRARSQSVRHVLAVGEGDALEQLIHRLEAVPELGLRIRGVVTNSTYREPRLCDKPVVGHFDDLSSVIRAGGIDEVLIALPPSQSDQLDRVLESLKDATVDVGVVPDVHRYATLGCEIEDFDGLPIVRINDSPVIGWAGLAKRVTDAALSVAALVVLSPLLFAIALAIKLSSRGPILYVQQRMGLDGRAFQMLKFRSMNVDAERVSGAVWASAADARRTKLGTFLRKTSLDELPQLWNVLCGDMSLVGPRPERPVFVDKFRSQIPHYMLRHKVRAGITGWAQVNGWRGNTSLDRRIECDLFYIRNWSYALDLKILTMTLWKGFVDKNAY